MGYEGIGSFRLEPVEQSEVLQNLEVGVDAEVRHLVGNFGRSRDERVWYVDNRVVPENSDVEIDVDQPPQSRIESFRNRTPEEVKAAKAVALSDLPDDVARNDNLAADAPATDENRTVNGHENWLVAIGICTHLGCIPIAHQGQYDGYFCPCHGSVYDTSGRIRSGPAPTNLALPPYEFVSDTKIKIG